MTPRAHFRASAADWNATKLNAHLPLTNSSPNPSSDLLNRSLSAHVERFQTKAIFITPSRTTAYEK